VRRRHQRRAGKGGDVERARILAVDQVAGAAQVRKVRKLLRRHDRNVPMNPGPTRGLKPCGRFRLPATGDQEHFGRQPDDPDPRS
jgi:hypothetical protein